MITHVDTSRKQLILVNALKIKAFYFWNKLHYKCINFISLWQSNVYIYYNQQRIGVLDSYK
jgi:hypothetical protein